MRRGWNDLVLGFNAERQQRLLQPFGINASGWRQDLVIAVRRLSPCSRWPGWHGCWPAANASAIRCCAPGTRWARATRGWAWAAKPHEPAGAWAERVVAGPGRSRRHLIPLSHRFADARYAAGIGDPTWHDLLHDLRRHRP